MHKESLKSVFLWEKKLYPQNSQLVGHSLK